MPTPVLLLSSDEQAVHVVTQVLAELGFATERPAEASSAIREIENHACSALVIDCDDLASAKLMFDASRRSKVNPGIPAIALVSGGTGLPTAFRLGAEFVITKPAALDQVRHTLRTASSKMKKDLVSAASASASLPPRANAATAGAGVSTSAAMGAVQNSVPTAPPSVSAPTATPVTPKSANAPLQSARTAAATAPARITATTPLPKLTPAEPVPSRVAQPPASTRSTSDDPILADLDDIENPGKFSPPPFTGLRLKPRTPFAAFVYVMVILVGAGGYAAWMMRPDFRAFVMYEYVKLRALIGKPVPPPPAPAPPAPKPAPVEVAPPAVPEGDATSTNPTTSGDSAPAVPAVEPAASSVPPAASSPQTHAPRSAANPQH